LQVILAALIIVGMVVLFLVSAALVLKSETGDEPIDPLRWTTRLRDTCTTVECFDPAYRGPNAR